MIRHSLEQCTSEFRIFHIPINIGYVVRLCTVTISTAEVSHCGFNLHVPADSEVEHVFMCLFAIRELFLVKHLFKCFAHFSKFFFLIVEFHV